METCKICISNKADKTGSHIIPHFLVKRIDNEDGYKGRDKELGFVFDIHGSRMYFGRAILPEKLEEVYGEVDDALLQNNVNDGIVDHYFCSECEKKLARIEDKYADTLRIFNEPNSNYRSTEESAVAFLFWVSIAWRLSIMPNSGYVLKVKEQNRLRILLNRYLNIDLKEIRFDESDPDLQDLGYKILRSANFSDSYPTFQYTDPFSQRPYIFMIDEYILFFYFKRSYLNGMVYDFFGSHQFVKQAHLNTAFDAETVFCIDHSDFKDILNKKMTFFAEKKISRFDKNLDLMHQRMFPEKGKKMELPLKKQIFENIRKLQTTPGKRTEKEIEVVKQTIIDYYRIPE